MSAKRNPPNFHGLNISGYTVGECCGTGAIGSVWKGTRNDHVRDVRAIKFFPSERRHKRWQEEINKTTRIQDHAPVVGYIDAGEIEFDGTEYTWIAWRFVSGASLKTIIDDGRLTLPLLFQVIRSGLAVLHACQIERIQHGDLHEGNVMIEDPNPLDIDDTQKPCKVYRFRLPYGVAGPRDVRRLPGFVGHHQ